MSLHDVDGRHTRLDELRSCGRAVDPFEHALDQRTRGIPRFIGEKRHRTLSTPLPPNAGESWDGAASVRPKVQTYFRSAKLGQKLGAALRFCRTEQTTNHLPPNAGEGWDGAAL